MSNDVPSLFAGSLVLLLGVLTLTRPGRWMAPVMFGAGALAAAFKLFDLLPVAVVAILLAILAVRELPSTSRRRGLTGVGVALVVAAWWSTAARWACVRGDLVDRPTSDRVIEPACPSDSSTPFARCRSPGRGLVHEALGILQPLTGSYHSFKSAIGHGVIVSPSRARLPDPSLPSFSSGW